MGHSSLSENSDPCAAHDDSELASCSAQTKRGIVIICQVFIVRPRPLGRGRRSPRSSARGAMRTGILLLCAVFAAAGPTAAADRELMADLASAASLFERGLLSAGEFAAAKARLLAPPPPPPPPIAMPQLKTFGTGQSAFVIPVNGSERTIFEHAVSAGLGSTGVMTVSNVRVLVRMRF